MPLTVVDCPSDARGAALRVAGMTLLERHVAEARRRGGRVIVRAPSAVVAPLGPDVEHLEESAPLPSGATVVRADELCGIRVTDSASRRRAEWALMQTCRRPYDGPADRFLLRSLSLRITRALTRLPVRPNHVTAVSSLCGLAACVLVALGDRGAVALAGVFTLAAVVLDSVDGELARVRHMGSALGMWFDNLSDDVIDTSLVLCIGIGLGGIWLPIAAAGAVARAFAAATIYAGAARLGKPGDVMAFRWWFESGEDTEAVYEDVLSPLTLVRSLGRRDVYMLLFALLFWAGFPLGALLLGLGNAIGHFALAVLHGILGRRR